ncbi:MAG: AMP-binding protein, partial [Bacteroidota bacterium]
NRSLWSSEEAERLIQHFKEVANDLLHHPARAIQEIAMLGQEERQRLDQFKATEVTFPKANTLLDRFRLMVEKQAQAVAICFREEHWTYEELDHRSNQLAHQLKAAGVGRGSLVAICLDRSLNMLLGLLAILKAGAAYVPIDPTYPAEQIRFMLVDTASNLLLCEEAQLSLLKDLTLPNVQLINITQEEIYRDLPCDLEWDIRPTDPAYVIYTSGSTGRPKGVVNEHAGVYNRLMWAQDYFDLTPEDVVLQKTTFCFDVSVWELFWPIMVGARIVFAEPEGHKDP